MSHGGGGMARSMEEVEKEHILSAYVGPDIGSSVLHTCNVHKNL